jgi:hypothetical protein
MAKHSSAPQNTRQIKNLSAVANVMQLDLKAHITADEADDENPL